MKIKNYHTSDVVRFVCISQCKETQDYYGKEINHIFEFLRDTHTNGIQHEGKTYRVNISFPANQSCHWKLLGMGWACKVASHFAICAGAHPIIVPDLGQGDVDVGGAFERTKINVTITSLILMTKYIKKRRK